MERIDESLMELRITKMWAAVNLITDAAARETAFDNALKTEEKQRFEFHKQQLLIKAAPALLESCIALQKRIDILVLLTPSGKLRNEITQENINALIAIDKATKTRPTLNLKN